MSKSIDYGWSYKSWARARYMVRGLNVISRFRFGAPPTFRAGASRRNIPCVWGQFRFVQRHSERRSPPSICCPLSTPFTSLRHPPMMRDGKIREVKGVGGKRVRGSFVLSRSDRKSGAVTDIISKSAS